MPPRSSGPPEPGPCPCAVTSPTTRSVARLVEQSEQGLGGPIDTLVNNAGVYRRRAFLDYTLEDWRWMLDVNVVAMVRVTAASCPSCWRNRGRAWINVSSIAGKKGTYGQAAYNAVEARADRSDPLPGARDRHDRTAGQRRLPGVHEDRPHRPRRARPAHGKPGADVWSTVEQAATIKRTVTLDEIAAAVVYLASPAADGVNGQSLVVDGGIVMS